MYWLQEAQSVGSSVRLLFMSGVAVPSIGECGVLQLDGVRQANPYTWIHCLLPPHSISFTIQFVCRCVCERACVKDREQGKWENIQIACVCICDTCSGYTSEETEVERVCGSVRRLETVGLCVSACVSVLFSQGHSDLSLLFWPWRSSAMTHTRHVTASLMRHTYTHARRACCLHCW